MGIGGILAFLRGYFLYSSNEREYDVISIRKVYYEQGRESYSM